MKRISLLLVLLAITMACKNETKNNVEETETAMENTEEKTTSQDSEWITLFDGTSMDQWRGYLTDEMYPEWTIEDGTLAFTPGEEGGKNIITKEKFTNFVLSLEWKISEKGNSGIFWGIYEDEKFPEAYETGPEIQVLDNVGHPDGKFPTHVAASLYDLIAAPFDAPVPVGEWNTCVLEVNHSTNLGKVTFNGNELFTFPVHGEEWDAMVADSKFKGWEGFGKYQTGHIGLQDHDDKVWYRNIKIKRLD
ncbi:MAG: DUF1080 domain-containing protein [Flavobacteriaceae bacterium]|nr:DUF1080 domain-containing protein [Flavobacteriaceae bacterium]